MKKEITFIIGFLVLIFGQVIAQPGSFSIKITQVYPAGGVVYAGTYNLSGELDKAEAKLRSQYTGKDANYIMELARPSGKETKTIQNIRWIWIKNKTKTNLKIKPEAEESYPEPTHIEYYACNNNGAKSSKESIVIDYNYSYCFYKGNDSIPDKKYRTLEDCKKNAEAYFLKNNVDTLLCKIKIYNSGKKEMVEYSRDNSKKYNEYKESLAKQKQMADSIPKTKPDTLQPASDYNKKKVEVKLKELENKAKSLKKGTANYRQDRDKIITSLDSIIAGIPITDTKKNFDRNKYFEGDLDDLKKGINELIKINDKRK